MSTTSSFYWFDYETFGTHPAWDRPCQFAGVRTDMDLNETGEPMVLYCKQSMDYLPHPAACKVTGLSPQQVNEKGIRENAFIERIVEQIGKPGTCSLGYNSIRFDDEFTRHTLFRNFHDPYEYEYKDGNSRWDLLDVVRLTRALRPEGIQWPFNDDGSPSNRLEHLSVANGIEHGQAHDALSDVRATIGMARLIRQTQPRLFDFAFNNRGKHAVASLLNTAQPEICLQVSSMIPASRSHIAAILPLTVHPDNRNSVIVLDLQQDPSILLGMSSEEIATALFQKTVRTSEHAAGTSLDSELHGNMTTAKTQAMPPRPGLGTVQINKCPVIVPIKTLRENDAQRLDIDMSRIRENARIAQALLTKDMLARIVSAMTRRFDNTPVDVEGSLYSGSFLSSEDRQRAEELRQADPLSINDLAAHFDDKRLLDLAWRYKNRNYPEVLEREQLMHWLEYCREKLNDTSSPWLSFEQFDQEMLDTTWTNAETSLKVELLEYRRSIQEQIENRADSQGRDGQGAALPS